MRVAAGKEAEIAALSEKFGDTERFPKPAGLVFDYIFKMDSDPREFFLVAGFESRDAYRANAESPEQQKQYETLRALLETDPEWYDGEIVLDYHE